MSTTTTTTTTTTTSIIVALLAIVVGGGIVALISPSFWISHDGTTATNSFWMMDGSRQNNNDNDRWEVETIQYAHRFRKRAVAREEEEEEEEEEKEDDDDRTTNETMMITPLQDVVVLITGATSGIGKELALWMFSKGATVIAMGRSTTKLEQLKQQAENQLVVVNNNNNIERLDEEEEEVNRRIIPIVSDFTDLTSVANAVHTMKKKSQQQTMESSSSSDYDFPDHIDIVVCNAGIHLGLSTFWDPYQVTQQGYDLVFGVNYLSHFLLTELLLDKTTFLERSNYPRIVHVTSTFHFAVDGSDLQQQHTTTTTTPVVDSVHEQIKLDPPTASLPGGSHGFVVSRSQRQYANSKLAQILHARYYQRKYPNITSYTACPSWVGTQIIQAHQDSLEARIFRSMAFPANGYGLSSILRSMLVTDTTTTTTTTTTTATTDNNNNNNNGLKDDFFINNKLSMAGPMLDDMLTKHPWIRKLTYQWLPIRDAMMFCAAMVLLHWQRVAPSVEPSRSSKASYDPQLQDELYQWSRQAIQEWLD
ncbi:short-chain dehydrogenase/reductase family protein [Nitzschia inconspicua]|uniref:Short-chain dehydrogenase/reductase family protein n=1 Tax=Nitzschia inconspicua TaxID=303405 RepID=A0A9K3KMJ4_9STRA|nr:short-chain dehydrogenase/reductase family protein [Nitzschia inconspicua]